ncbi:MAG: hypothetical protein WCH31_08945 [Actinomycetes bacterium]
MKLSSYPRERLLIALIALATFPMLAGFGAQDTSRMALSESIVSRGSVDIDPYWRGTLDRSFKSGHWYSDKAPGISFLLVPAEATLHVVDAIGSGAHGRPPWERPIVRWLFRLVAGGLPLLGLVILIGRASEGLIPGTGGAAAVVFGLGTMAGSLGPTVFGHLASALMLFGGFILASRAASSRAWLGVGALGGGAVLFEYLGGMGTIVLAVYALIRGGRGAALRVVLGGVPAALLLGLYDWAAFGSPFHLSYSYVANQFAGEQSKGLFGIGVPSLHGLADTFINAQGLLIVSPVLVLAAIGYRAFVRAARREALTAAVIAAAYVITTTGYFLPHGGDSPGPRFAAAALPFLMLGFPFALVRYRLATAALALYSVGMAMFDEITWTDANALDFIQWPETVYSHSGFSARLGTLAVLVAAGAAVAVVAPRTLAAVRVVQPVR